MRTARILYIGGVVALAIAGFPIATQTELRAQQAAAVKIKMGILAAWSQAAKGPRPASG